MPVPRRAPTRPAAASQRERILDAARALFARGGFEDVTMAQVAELAGVARATVFNHFGSKHALVEAITEGVLAYWVGMLERALADERTPTTSLVRALFDLMGFGIEQLHGFYRGVFREIMKVQVGLDEGGAPAEARARALALLERLIARGQARGELSSEFGAMDLAVAFDSLANGTINHWLYDDTSGSLREHMRRAVAIFLRPVATPGLPPDPLPPPNLLAPGDEGPEPPLPIPLQRARTRRRR
jgi:AcrR family transcriptional regulator